MATALELGPEGCKPYIEALRQRPERVLTPEEIAEREALIAKAREAAAMLKAQYGATRVILFGSLAHQAWYGKDSDVDLAAEGLREGTWIDAWRDAERMIGYRRLDLVSMAAISASVRRAVERDGIVL